MGLSKENITDHSDVLESINVTTTKKRRIRRKKLREAKALNINNNINCNSLSSKENTIKNKPKSPVRQIIQKENRIVEIAQNIIDKVIRKTIMSSKENSEKSRESVLAAREAKKLEKQKAKKKEETGSVKSESETVKKPELPSSKANMNSSVKTDTNKANAKGESPKSKDEVDRAVVQTESISSTSADKSKENVKAERAAKKAAKQAKKKPDGGEQPNKNDIKEINDKLKTNDINVIDDKIINDMTMKDVVNTLKDIVNVAKEVQAVTDKVRAIDFSNKKPEETTKSKAELRAERRAKQEAQRAAKQNAQPQKTEVKPETSKTPAKPKEEKQVKSKTAEKPKVKSQTVQKMNWFQHLHTKHDKESLKKMSINSNLHPAVIKLGVQLASHVVTGSNARCIALLDVLKKVVRDYSLPARTEFARGLESQVASIAEFLWSMRPPAASQTNALKYFRHQLTQLPNNVDEFDAKKVLQEEIDRYIREQIDKAGEAISLAVRQKISDGDNILTYGCSSLVERIISEAHAAGVRFRAVVVGTRMSRAQELLRRLTAHGVPASYADISALSALMRDMNKVVVGAASLLVNGAVLAPVGTLQVALVARAHNVPLLVACETHKFADTVQTDAFVYNEIGDPDDLIDKTDENSPLKDWRSNPNLSLLNLTYDVTPPSLVTAVVTELGILPCTSAPVVVRYKLSEYGM